MNIQFLSTTHITQFDDLHIGEVFVALNDLQDNINRAYMKIDDVETREGVCNAVNLGTGEVTYFDDYHEVEPMVATLQVERKG